jgi:O-acetyl-ADP-ribose deacetylase (regulator of RNase III)
VIHTVGPVWTVREDRAGLLRSCYVESLRVADELGARTVAFPAISTGAYGFPLERAARIALEVTADELERRPDIERVTFVLFGEDALRAFEGTRREPAEASS